MDPGARKPLERFGRGTAGADFPFEGLTMLAVWRRLREVRGCLDQAGVVSR